MKKKKYDVDWHAVAVFILFLPVIAWLVRFWWVFLVSAFTTVITK